ncbi:hypothetical protein B7463_g5934, partial [Scytalidium lignicola]
MSIRPLPPDVVAQIKSSTSITSLNGVILELVKNSLDAACTKVDVTVDYARGGCVVEDDGFGIPPSEFGEEGGLGKPYHSSKFYLADQTYGSNGALLSSLSALSLLSITSHHHFHHSYNTIQMSRSRVISRHTPAPVEHQFPYLKHGTRVTVRDLFGAMPVRVKQRAMEAENLKGTSKFWDELKKSMVALLLSWPPHVAMIVRDPETSQKFVIRPSMVNQLSKSPPITSFNLRKVYSILSQAQYTTRMDWGSWVVIGASTSKLNISGAISLQPSPSKRVQFLSLGIEPLICLYGQNILYDEINRLFMNSSFGNEEGGEQLDELTQERGLKEDINHLDYTKKELRGSKKGVDRWPMFYMRIEILDHPKTSERFNIDSFLDVSLKAPFRPRNSRHELLTTISNFPQVVADQNTRTIYKEISDDPSSENHITTNDQPLPKQVPSTQRKLPQHRKGAFDPLSGNVQLPNFRQSSKSHSPFDAWSRIKSGTPVQKYPAEAASHQLSERETSIRAHLGHEVDSVLYKWRATSNPLICKAGKVARPPFNDVQLQSHQHDSTKPDMEDNQVDVAGEGDETVYWLDPITKVKSVVNLRTGHVISSEIKNGRITLEQFSGDNLTNIDTSSKLDPPTPGLTRHSSPWINNLLNKWENPVFRPPENQIQKVHHIHSPPNIQGIQKNYCLGYSEFDIERAFQEHPAGICGRLSKHSLRSAEVISQVDKKFILIKIMAKNAEKDAVSPRRANLVIVDQHAADERVRIEDLMVELCKPSNEDECYIMSMALDRPMVFEISHSEGDMLLSQRQHFANWGILYDIQSELPNGKGGYIRLVVRGLPLVVMERYKLDPKLLISHIRSEIWKKEEGSVKSSAFIGNNNKISEEVESTYSWVRRIHDCPQGLIDVLNSRSCRSAIMFNDELPNEQCEKLLSRLADCAFPFQCAHGRPSMVPLLELEGVSMGAISQEYGTFNDFGKSLKKWKVSHSQGY